MSFGSDNPQKKTSKNVQDCSTISVSLYRITVQTIFSNDRLEVRRLTSLKKVYSNVQTFFVNLYGGESNENRQPSRTRISRVPRGSDP